MQIFNECSITIAVAIISNVLQIAKTQSCAYTGSAVAAASDIHRQLPTHMADVRRDWLTNQNTDWCFVVIGVGRKTSHSPLQQLKIDPVRQTCSAILVGI